MELASTQPPLLDWLKRAVDHYRRRTSQEPELTTYVDRYRNLAAPCQILGFSVVDPPWQGFIVAHAPGLDDQRIQVREGILRWKMFEAMSEAFLDPLWDQPMSKPVEPHATFLNMREVGFRALDQLINSQRSSLYLDYSRMGRPFIQYGYVNADCAEYNHMGPLSNVSPEAWVDEAFTEARQQLDRERERAANPSEQGPLPASQERPYAAYGAFHAKQVRIGQVTSTTLSDWYWANREFPGIIVYRGTIGGFQFKATQNGFFSIESPTRSAAHEWVNYIMAGFLSQGLPTVVVREQDMASVHLPLGTDHTWGGSFPGLDHRRRGSIFDQWRISNEELECVLRVAEHHAKQSYARHIASFLEAYTHLEGHETTQSFVFSWSIIEQELAGRWHTYLESTGISRSRRKKLESTNWTLDDRCEILQIAGAINQHAYDQLASVRSARNRILHGRELATHEQAEQALGLADQLMTEGGSPVRGRKQKSPWESRMEEFL